jgi:hypothetical protein
VIIICDATIFISKFIEYASQVKKETILQKYSHKRASSKEGFLKLNVIIFILTAFSKVVTIGFICDRHIVTDFVV